MVQQEEETDRGTTHTRVKCLLGLLLIPALELSLSLMRDQDLFRSERLQGCRATYYRKGRDYFFQ
jgi:hypothetical protein